MNEAILDLFSMHVGAYSSKYEHVLILPMPRACEPDDAPLGSPEPFRPSLHLALHAVLVGHLNHETQMIESASLFEEEISSR